MLPASDSSSQLAGFISVVLLGLVGSSTFYFLRSQSQTSGVGVHFILKNLGALSAMAGAFGSIRSRLLSAATSARMAARVLLMLCR